MSKLNLIDFTRKLDALSEAYKRLPSEIATIAVNFSKERFIEQNWKDASMDKWKPLKNRRRGGKKKSQTILVNTGRLKRSIRKISATDEQIVIGTDVPYAQIHNEGGTIKGTFTVKEHQKKAHTRKRKGRNEKVKAHTVRTHTRNVNTTIPKRQFMGSSQTLEKRILLHITKEFSKALKS